MPKSRWRLLASGATVVVGAATGVVTNLITSRWGIGLAAGLGVLLVIGVILQVALASSDSPAESADRIARPSRPSVRQDGRARGRSMIIQAGGDVTLRSGDGSASPADSEGSE